MCVCFQTSRWTAVLLNLMSKMIKASVKDANPELKKLANKLLAEVEKL